MSWTVAMDRGDEQVELAFAAPDLEEAMRRFQVAAGMYKSAGAVHSELWCLRKACDCWKAICAGGK